MASSHSFAQPEASGPPAASDVQALPDRIRLPLHFDPQELASDLDRINSEIWTSHFVQQNYVGDWSILPLRIPQGASHPILRAVSHSGIDAWEDSELLTLSPAFRQVLASLPCPIGAARLMRLTPGSSILEHRDPDLAPEFGAIRLHVPVTSNDDVDFRLNGIRVDMLPGECWYLRLADRHSAHNGGTTTRIHMVVDVTANPAIVALLQRGAAG